MVYLVPFLLDINHHLINLYYSYTFTGMYSKVLMCYDGKYHHNFYILENT